MNDEEIHLERQGLRETALQQLKQVEKWFRARKQRALKDVISAKKINAKRKQNRALIKKASFRAQRFMKNIKGRFERYNAAYLEERITHEQMQEVRTWAKDRMNFGRSRFTKYRKKIADEFNETFTKNEKLKKEKMIQLKVDWRVATEREKLVRANYAKQDGELKFLQSPDASNDLFSTKLNN